MTLTKLEVTGPEAEAYLKEILSRETQRIGREILMRPEPWSAWAIVPGGTSADRAVRFQEGGLIYPALSSVEWLSGYYKHRGDIGSLLWEDPWMHKSDVENQMVSEYYCFFFDGCAYSFLPNDGVNADMIRAGEDCTISYVKCCYGAASRKRRDIFNAPFYASFVKVICISSYDDEGYVLFERQEPSIGWQYGMH